MRIALILIALALWQPAVAEEVTGYTTQPATVTAKQTLNLTVSKIDFRKDLTRVYCTLTGKPHTSGRIDSATLSAGKLAMSATDIDPVEMKRYFQLEDEGIIELEIDFPATRPFKRGSITLVTAHGPITYLLR